MFIYQVTLSRGMGRMTKQKQLLYGELNGLRSFFDAPALRRRVARKDPRIGLATVYRFLKTLEENGTLHHYICGDRKVYSLSEKNHSHFCCEHCGETKHLELKRADFLSAATDEEICHFQINVMGICSRCRASQSPSAGS